MILRGQILPDSANTLPKSSCPHLPASKGVGGRPDVTMESQIDNVSPKNCIFDLLGNVLFATRETLKHREPPSGVDLRFVYVLLCFEFYKIDVFSSLGDCAENIEKHEAEWPFKT